MINYLKDKLNKLTRARGAQDGVAILLTVMIVSGITVITTTVAFFVIQEIRNSRASSLTEPAIVAAETAGEQGIYRLKRDANFSAPCSSAPYTTLDGTTTSNSSTRIRSCMNSGPVIFQFTSADPLVVYLYDESDVNGNTCMEDDTTCPVDGNGSGTQLYDSFIVKYLTGTNFINIDMDTLDGVEYKDDIVSPGSTSTMSIDRNILNSQDERLRITLTPTGGTATVEISTTGKFSSGSSNSGLPDYRTLDAEGCVSFGQSIDSCDSNSEIYTRRINITLPR